MTISERVAYTKGLAEGFGLDESKNECRLIKELIEIVDELASDLEDANREIERLNDYIEEIDEDLGDLESYTYEDDDEYDDDFDDSDFISAECPSCGETIYLDDSVDPDDVTCPACGAKFSCEPFEDNECACGCGHHQHHDDGEDGE